MSEKAKYVVACDFDGWITNTRPGGKNFYNAYVNSLNRSLGLISPDERQLGRTFVNRGLEQVYEKPGVYGWEIDGKIVAPAETDPFTLTRAAAQIAFGLMRMETRIELPSKKYESILMDTAYQEAYPESGVHFRDGALSFIETFYGPKKHPRFNLPFITNSNTKEVRRKLTLLLQSDESGVKPEEVVIIGDAKKQKLGSDKSIQIPGVPRPIYVDRKQYRETLDEIDADGVTGDTIEMDILPALLLGLNAIWMDSSIDGPIILTDEVIPSKSKFLQIEGEFLKSQDNVQIVTALGQAAQAIMSFSGS